MKTKGCLACLIVLIAMLAIFIVAIRHVQSRFHPVYHGKRLVEWADEAKYSEDPTTRRKAVEVLREACNREGEEARLPVYKEFVITQRGLEPVEQLPEELLPFLLERFKLEDHCAVMIAGGLEKCPPSLTVPQLSEMLKVESDPWKKELLNRTLDRIRARVRQVYRRTGSVRCRVMAHPAADAAGSPVARIST